MRWIIGFMLAATAGAASAQTAIGDASAGQALAEETCAVCHAVAAGADESPVQKATAFPIIARDPRYSELGLRVFLRSPHAAMPNLVLAPDEIDDISAYLATLRDQG